MKVKVLHLISSPFDLGGAESLLLDMADIYDPEQFEVSYCNLFCDPSKESRFNQQLRERGLRDLSISGNSILSLPRVIIKLISLIRRERFDIVNTHLTHATFIGWLAIRLARISKFVTCHHYTNNIFQNSDMTFSRKLAGRLSNFAAHRANRIIAVSHAVKNDLLSDGCGAQKIVVIHNGIDLDAFDKRLEQPSDDLTGQWQGGHILATVGSLTERKGHHIAIRAMQGILQQYPDAVLLIVGSGELETPLKELADQLDVSQHVFFAGFQKNVARYLKICDLYMHPALQEPFGIAILEAMAANKCLVATNVGGIPEIVIDNETGFLIPPSNPDLLADAVCRSFSDPARMAQMANAGRQRVDDFDIGKVVSHYQNCYLKILGRV